MPRVTIIVTGEEKIIADLSRRSGPQLASTLRKATRAGATAAKPFIAAASPVRTGKTRKSVSVRGSKQGIGASVGPRIWYRHFQIVGTKRGIRPNPWVARGAAAGASAAKAVMETITKADVRT
jgi:hypothetical protein